LFTSPEHWKKMYTDYQKVKACISIHNWNWFALVPRNTLEVRNEIFIQKKQSQL
jgi:hypothetical protein